MAQRLGQVSPHQFHETVCAMSSNNNGIERRKFGRREFYVRGLALIPGHRPLPFGISNISEGGAFLVFDEPIVPRTAFRISFESYRMNILCDVRHHNEHGVGIRFLDARAGAELDRFLRPKHVTVPGAEVQPAVTRPASRPAAEPVSVRDLRRTYVHQDGGAAEGEGSSAERTVFEGVVERLRRAVDFSASKLKL